MSRSFDSMSFTTRPSMEIVPALISSRPASMRSSVDLPQPEGPTSTMNSPSLMSKPMPWMTLVVPKVFSMFWNDTDAMFGPLAILNHREHRENSRVLARSSPCPLCSLWWTLFQVSTLHRARGQPADHVALEHIINRGRGHRIDEPHRHQELPGRI